MLTSNPTGGAWRNLGRAAAVVALGAALATPAQAVRFKLADGAIDGSFDTTIGWGMSMRTRSHNPTLAGGIAGMYGNRSVAKWEVFNNTIKASHDLSLTGNDWGVFVRGNYSYDQDADHEELSSSAQNAKVTTGIFTDAYVYFRFGSDDQFNLRLGKQVISWGENTFIGNSINDINTVDLTKLRVPGVELKDAFIGTPAVSGSWQINDAFTLEAFALFAFDEFAADPAGGFFLTNDAFGNNQAFADPATGRCLSPDGGGNAAPGPFSPAGAGFGETFCSNGDELPSGGGQWGIALRYYAADLGNGVDFGFYYQNLHDHVFKLGAIAGSANPLSGPGPSGRFFRWFPENIERWGISWNTTAGSWAWGGEYAYRRNMKLQGDANVILGAVAFGGVNTLNPSAAPVVLTPGSKFKEDAVRDYGHHRVQMTFQRLWGPMPEFRADQWNTIFEVVHGWNTSMPGQSTFDRFDENISNNYQGFRGRSNLTYNNALFNSVNMTFNTVLNWDLRGYSPEFGGAKAFIEDRKSFTLGMDFDYKLRYKWGVSHTWFWGGTPSTNDIGDPRTGGPALGPGSTPRNGVTDRDFLAFHASYSF
jgi:hypothetical protein